MKCLHCQIKFHDSYSDVKLGSDAEGLKTIRTRHCPECKKLNLSVLYGGQFVNGDCIRFEKETFVHPRGSNRPSVPKEVKDASSEIANDFTEACVVMSDSAKASAALGRRCLQNLLREKAGVKPSSLDSEISEVIASKALPSHLADSIDAIRVIGNFAAHPVKSTNSGAIVPVENGEAEWTLDVLEGLFDFYYVQPAILQKKRDALNTKLAEAGKPPLK